MRVIYCNIDPFAYDQKVYAYGGDSQIEIGKAPINNLPQFITNQCNELNISEVTLTGVPHYANDVANKILEYSKTKYSNKNITVTVR